MGREEAGRLEKEKENDGINAEVERESGVRREEKVKDHISAAVPPGW
jgi:hypothetical protein